MTPTPSPTPDAPWIVVESPLIVFPDGSAGLLISIIALLVSGVTLWHTLSARPRVHAFVVRSLLQLGDIKHTDGDEVVIVNLGRTSAVIYDVRALDGKGGNLRAKVMPRGYNHEDVPFPEMPQSLAPGGVLTVWFSSNLISPEAGLEHGYRIEYANVGVLRRVRTTPHLMVVKATANPQAVV